MLTKDSTQEAARQRSITIPFYVAVSVVLLICAMLTAGALVLSTTGNLEKSPRTVLNEWAINAGWMQSKDVRIRAALTKLPLRFAESLLGDPDLPTLVIDIAFKHQEALRAKREAALEQGMLIQEEGDLVPADIRIGNRQVKVRLRLKGDQSDHLDSDKWSMRVEVRDNDHILGMRRFSLQHPKVRSYHAEPIFMESLRHAGVLAVRYQFVDVIINGVPKGIMAVEEHFSKELLEHQARREGVFARFDETDFWDFQKAGGNWRGSPYDNFRNSRVTTFQAGKIAASPLFTAQFRTAAGLLRSFAAGRATASEVFDVETLASYLAVMELWGNWHSIQWNDMRFYLDPLTLKLEPVGYDAHPMYRSDYRAVTLGAEPIFAEMLRDPLVRAAYVERIREICRDVTEGSLGPKLAELQEDLLAILQDEFLLLEPMDLEKLVERAEFLLTLDDSELLQDPEDYPRRIRYPALVQANLIDGQDGSYVEIANVLPEPVTVTSIQWRNLETGAFSPVETAEPLEVPFDIEPTIHGEAPEFGRLHLANMPDDVSELVISARYKSWPIDREIRPEAYVQEIGVNPLPMASSADQLSIHPFLAPGDGEHSLRIRPGAWQVASDIVIPPGYSLSAGPGTRLEFAADAALVSYGPVRFSGTEDSPVVLSGIESGKWPGLVVIRAQDKSVLQHVQIEDTFGIIRDAWQLTGGTTFYHSDVDFSDVSISRHAGEDALNIVRSHFDIERLRISDAFSDAFDGDFTTGVIRNSEFTDIGQTRGGGDAIDFSGSDTEVHDIRFHRIQDKALSVGEASRVRASNLIMDSVGTAVASKDGSQLTVEDVDINEIIFAGLMAYTKKPEYGPASMIAAGIRFLPDGPVGRVQDGSAIILDGEELPTEDLDVDLLYETVMSKGL